VAAGQWRLAYEAYPFFMRFLERLRRRGRNRQDRDPRLEAALIEKRLKEQKSGVREQRDLEDYSSRGSGYVGR
jgi:hypothetical protein